MWNGLTKKKQEKSQIFKYSKLQSFLGEKKKSKTMCATYFLLFSLQKQNCSWGANSIICNESQLNGGCQTQLTYQFSADIVLSNWRRTGFFKSQEFYCFLLVKKSIPHLSISNFCCDCLTVQKQKPKNCSLLGLHTLKSMLFKNWHNKTLVCLSKISHLNVFWSYLLLCFKSD